jgi:hypothetical protein
MTKKNNNTKSKRNIASGFDDVAKINNDNVNEVDEMVKTEVDTNNDTDNSINNNDDTVDVIDDILGKKKSTRVQRGLYLDRDVDAALSKLGKKGGKGAKSDIVNALLREGLQNRELL